MPAPFNKPNEIIGERWENYNSYRSSHSPYIYFQSHIIGQSPYDFDWHATPTEDLFLRWHSVNGVWESRQDDYTWVEIHQSVIGHHIRSHNLMPVDSTQAFCELL